jgi:hypothetical protein
MITPRWFLSIATLALFCLLGAGCFGQQALPYQSDPGHITLERADAAAGVLIGTYEWHGVHLRFEGVRGEENPALERMNPNTPHYAIDARICDALDYARGWCFAIGAGGHALTDDSWSNSPSATPPDTETTLGNLKAAWQLATDLEAMGSELRGLEDVRDAIARLGRANPPETWHEDPNIQQSNNTTTPQEGVVVLPVTSGTYTQWFEIWWGLTPVPGTEHSSTRTKAVDASGRATLTYDTYNHGGAPGSSGMMRLCSRSFPNRTAWIPISSNCGSQAFVTCSGNGCCGTPYGLLCGQHVCNDDSHLQRDLIVANAAYCASYMTYCGDWLPAAYAPYCW